MRLTKVSKWLGVFLFLSLAGGAFAQTKRRVPKPKTTDKTAAEQTKTAEGAPTEIKKNARPATESAVETTETAKPNQRPNAAAAENQPVYLYEFAQPNFVVSKIEIAHDENGKGKITFLKQAFSDPVSDPLQLSAATLERVKAAFQALNFLDSTADYQYEKDYSHLGNMSFTLNKDGKSRTAKFNWTENKEAKTLADEYHKISQQFIWIFDINVARENQPLDAPRLMDALDSMMRRGEIADSEQMVPLLNELTNDERIPLIARNHAGKLVKQIEKKK